MGAQRKDDPAAPSSPVWPVVAGAVGAGLAVFSDPIVILAAVPGGAAVFGGIGDLGAEGGWSRRRAWIALALGIVALFASVMGVWDLANQFDFIDSEPPLTPCEISPFCDDFRP